MTFHSLHRLKQQGLLDCPYMFRKRLAGGQVAAPVTFLAAAPLFPPVSSRMRS